MGRFRRANRRSIKRRRMRELSLFTGVGGGIWGSKLLGWKTIGYVEYDDYCQKIIRQRIEDGIFDRAPIFTDIRLFAVQYAKQYRGLVDIVTAGFPCQPFSTAGQQRAQADERNMWTSTLDVLRKVQPKRALLENVPGLLGKHGYFGTILKDLDESGYNAEWVCISAGGVGAPHKRNRLWILATHTESRRLEGVNQSDGSDKVQTEGVFSESSGSSIGAGSSTEVEDSDGERLERSEQQRRKIGERSRSFDSSWWQIEPDVGRVAHGVSDWRYRLKALGNAQVPGVVREAWQTLIGGADE